MHTSARKPVATSASRRRRGFTLFEVLAAVAILGILTTVLANIAMQAMRFEGDADRRLRASFLADRVLGDLERGFALGTAPPVDSTDLEEDEFRVTSEVRPFDLAGFAATLAAEETAAGPEGSRVEAQPPALLAAPARGAPPILEIEVVVSWTEGVFTQEIRRLTYGFDVNAAAPLLETLGPAEGPESDGGDGPELDPRGTLGQPS